MTNVPVIIVRTQPGAGKTQARVKALGYSAIVSPVLTLQSDSTVLLSPLTGFSGLVFTSANGVRFFAQQHIDRTLPAWCVGPATATAAKQAGFETVHESSGNAVTLAAFITSTVAPPTKPLLHIANAAAKDDFQREMKMRHYKAKFAPLYRAVHAPKLDDAAISALRSSEDCVILIHSAKGAEAFHSLAKALPKTDANIVAISSVATRPLQKKGYKSIHVAPRPNENALMQALESVLDTLQGTSINPY